jgi:hopanoid biosynthesis associated protein HpnK
MPKHLIITADDFGLHEAVNEGVEFAARNGVLTAASLMVAAPAAADAVRRAARIKNLNVGLHLVLADGRAVLEPSAAPDLTDAAGNFGNRMVYDAVRFFLIPRVRKQLEAEIRAQFAAFARTGLQLDHVNAHKHFHLHPTILEIVLRVARDYGTPAIRVPKEPLWFALRHRAGANAGFLTPWLALMKWKLRRAGVSCNDTVFGVAASGAMDEATLLQVLARLPPGVTEIYLHPATVSGATVASGMLEYRQKDELAALISHRVRNAIADSGAVLGGFRDCLSARSAAA